MSKINCIAINIVNVDYYVLGSQPIVRIYGSLDQVGEQACVHIHGVRYCFDCLHIFIHIQIGLSLHIFSS